jgi:hypothetical protein
MAIVRQMYVEAKRLATSEEQYFAVHGRRLAARLHHMILSQDPAADLGFFHETHG